MSIRATVENIDNLVRSARELRDRLWSDAHRPRYHLMPPDGFFNDANGTFFGTVDTMSSIWGACHFRILISRRTFSGCQC